MTIPEQAGPENIRYRGKLFEIIETPMHVGDKEIVFESARRAPGTRLIIPTTGSKIMLTKEYRVETGGYDVRLPGGKVFDTLSEYDAFRASGDDIIPKAMGAARKEAREEVGIDAKELALFAISKCGATVEWDLYYFVVRGYEETGRRDSDEGEDIANVTASIEDARRMCLDGTVGEDRSALMLLRYLEKSVA